MEGDPKHSQDSWMTVSTEVLGPVEEVLVGGRWLAIWPAAGLGVLVVYIGSLSTRVYRRVSFVTTPFPSCVTPSSPPPSHWHIHWLGVGKGGMNVWSLVLLFLLALRVIHYAERAIGDKLYVCCIFRSYRRDSGNYYCLNLEREFMLRCWQRKRTIRLLGLVSEGVYGW